MSALCIRNQANYVCLLAWLTEWFLYYNPEPESSCSCCIHPSNSTVEYGQWLNLTFFVQPCNISDVHWYTTGYKKSLDNSDLLIGVNADYEISLSENVLCQNNVKVFQFNVRITEDTHRILNGAITAYGQFNDNFCYSVPSARYYVASLPGKVMCFSITKSWFKSISHSTCH